MCMEDIRLGRQDLFTETNVPVANVSGSLVSPGPNCITLIFSPPLAGTVTISTISPVVSGVGFALNAGGLPLMFNIRDHGALCNKPWFAIGSVATSIQVGVGLLAQQ
jgi:hypothetical protein